MSGREYVEAIVTLKSGADRGRVAEWFEQRGFVTTAMAAGLLISASESELQTAFGLKNDLESLSEKEQRIQVPAELRDAVESIVVPPPPSLHQRRS